MSSFGFRPPLPAVALVLASVVLICAARSLAGRASSSQQKLLGDFTFATRPEARLTRKTRSTLTEMQRLDQRLASMSSHDRTVLLRLEQRRLSLAQCDESGCRAAAPANVHIFHEYTEEMRNNYRTSGGSQQPKGVGTFRIGDPVLNKFDKSIYRRRCENDRDCVTDDWRTLSNESKDDPEHENRQRLWRKTQQLDRSIDISANDDMQVQMQELIKNTKRSIDECNQQFAVVSDDAIKHCERRTVRHSCYIFESQNQICDSAQSSRHDRFTGTVCVRE